MMRRIKTPPYYGMMVASSLASNSMDLLPYSSLHCVQSELGMQEHFVGGQRVGRQCSVVYTSSVHSVLSFLIPALCTS